MQASIKDLLKLSSTAAKYRTPFFMERFIDASVNLETHAVDCCINGWVAFTHLRTQQTVCDACGAARYTASRKPAKKVIYWSLIAWLAHLRGDPVIGKAMLKNMAAACTAAEKGADGVHDNPHSENFRPYLDRKLQDGGPFIPVIVGTDGCQIFRQIGFEGWPVTATGPPRSSSHSKIVPEVNRRVGPEQVSSTNDSAIDLRSLMSCVMLHILGPWYVSSRL